MLALEVTYLTGRAAATDRSDYQSAEWPPHPGRLFMALVAAHAERDLEDAADRASLLWLEALPPPALTASSATRRDIRAYYVPANDPKGIDVLPEYRTRSDRTFPSVTPAIPSVTFSWPGADAGEVARHRPSLARLAALVTYLGHSSSLVHLGLIDDPPAPTLVPSDRGGLILRIATPGRLADLMADYRAGRRPSPGFQQAYTGVEDLAGPADQRARSRFDRPLAIGLRGSDHLPISAATHLTRAVRDALMSLADQPPLEVLSGHAVDGSPSTEDHVAILALPFIGHPHASGAIKGFALSLPRGCQDRERAHVLGAAGRLRRLRLGRLGAWDTFAAADPPGLRSLRVDPYEGPSRGWSTVTPVILDRFCGEAPGREAASLGLACRRIGLPEPTSVEVSEVSRFRGVPTSREFAGLARPGLRSRPRRHVRLRFDRPVQGPILLGAGRFFGLGLFRADFDGSQP